MLYVWGDGRRERETHDWVMEPLELLLDDGTCGELDGGDVAELLGGTDDVAVPVVEAPGCVVLAEGDGCAVLLL